MSLSTTLNQIKRTLPSPRADRVFQEARARHEALSAHDCASAVLAALGRGSTLSPEKRDAIVVALLAELQASTDSLWQWLLLAAFQPMLVGLRRRTGPGADEDLDGIVLLSFLEVARTVRASAYATRSLRLATEAKVSAHHRDERRARRALAFDEEEHAGVACDVNPRAWSEAREVVRIVEAEGGDELCRVLVETYGSDESLRTYVNRTYAGFGETDRASTYDRLCRARLRVVAKLRGERQRPGAIAA